MKIVRINMADQEQVYLIKELDIINTDTGQYLYSMKAKFLPIAVSLAPIDILLQEQVSSESIEWSQIEVRIDKVCYEVVDSSILEIKNYDKKDN